MQPTPITEAEALRLSINANPHSLPWATLNHAGVTAVTEWLKTKVQKPNPPTIEILVIAAAATCGKAKLGEPVIFPLIDCWTKSKKLETLEIPPEWMRWFVGGD